VSHSQTSVVSDEIPASIEEAMEGVVVEEKDLPVDSLGNPQFDLVPGAVAPEPLPADLEERLEELSALREQMAEAVADGGTPLVVPPLEDPDAPPRMDSGAVETSTTEE
jgi:hypothetical protein